MTDSTRFHVDPINGSDRRGDGSEAKPVRSFRRAHELIAQLVVRPTTIALLSDGDPSNPLDVVAFSALGIRHFIGSPRVYTGPDPRDPLGATRRT